jgi:hypothetical protein
VEQNYLQFLGSHNLLNVLRVAIEHENQGFIIEVADLGFERSDVVDSVALR